MGGRNKAELKQEFIKSAAAHNARLCVCQHAKADGGGEGGGKKTSGLQQSRDGGEENVGKFTLHLSTGALIVFPRMEKANFLVLPIGFSGGARVIKTERALRSDNSRASTYKRFTLFFFFGSLPAPSPHFLELQPPQEAEHVSAAVSLQSSVHQHKQRHEISACV